MVSDPNKIQEKLKITPDKSGVYLMRDERSHIVYIGKAKNLNKRVASYFRGSHDTKTTAMVQKVVDFDFFTTLSEKDALGLEANLIKKHKPHYNILLKDNKQFPYIKITNEKFPRLEVTRKVKKDGKYFGPYFDGIRANDFLRTIHDIFQIRDCTTLGKTPCINHQMGRCVASCMGNQSNVAEIIAFLRGEKDYRHLLEQKMQQASDMQQFEMAIRYREGLKFLDKLKERTITQVPRDLNCDVFGSYSSGEIFVVSVLTVRAGKLIGIQNFTDQGINHDIESFVEQYYLENPRVETIITAEKGVKRKLLDMANANAKEYMNTSIEKINFKKQFNEGACEELAKVLGLGNIKRIECFDISHNYGDDTVASMVVAIDGRMEKKEYRRFKIKSHTSIDDYASHREVLTRRIARTDWDKPDLIVIDGGKGQLSAVRDLTDIPMVAFSEINYLYTPDKITLPPRSYALRLLQRIRDEAHRFAVTYHKKLRKTFK